jgi:precorrin-4/cobalt-precorrin-4 C11-methyltransferase
LIHFIGAGPGAADLITVRGAELLKCAGMIVYAGSLVNPELLRYAPQDCEVYNSASMTLEEVLEKLISGERRGLVTVRLHTGDPSLYGAIREQMDRLADAGVEYEVVPGVSSFCAAAAAVKAEFTLPGVSQSLIISRMEGRTPVPAPEKIELLAAHRTSMVLFLSTGMLDKLCVALISGGYAPHTKAVLVYKASWPEEKVLRGDLTDIAEKAEEHGIKSTALLMVGDFLGDKYELSKLYDAGFSHAFREAKKS